MSEVAEPILTKDDIWKAHVLKARASRLSDAKYCRKNELSTWTFSAYKKRLGYTKPRIPKPASELSAFVRAVAPLPEQKKPELAPQLHPVLPDAIWLASFARALLETKK
jgi:hypothetical protein